MSRIIVRNTPTLAVTFLDFLAGKAVDFGAGLESFRFSYEDSEWYALDALSPGRPVKDATYNFARLPHWMRAEAKECIASAWLERGLSAGTLQNHMKAMIHIGRAFPQFKGSLLDLGSEHAKKFTAYLGDELKQRRLAAVTCVNTVITLRSVIQTLRHLPANANRPCTFLPRAPKAARQEWARRKPAFNAPPEKVIPDDTIIALLRACRAEEDAFQSVLDGEATARELILGVDRARADPSAGPHEAGAVTVLRDRAIKAQLVKFAICFGRRISALCALPVGPELEEVETEHGRVLLLFIHEPKIKKSTEVVRAPGYFAEIALDALAKTIRYTAGYRAAAGDVKDYLFLTSSSKEGSRVKVATGDDINRYLSGYGQQGRKNSLVSRHGIKRDGTVAHITSHNFRTTRITQLAELVGPTVASQDAGHLSLDMTSQFYIAATGPLRAQAERALREGRVAGEAAEMIAGTRAEGERVSTRLVRRLIDQDQPLVVNVTRYGLCYLQADTGPCPTGNPCWLGINPDAAQISAGTGCEWQGLTPAAVPALMHDEQTLLAQIETYATDGRFRHFVANLERRLSIVRLQLSRARELQTDGGVG